MPTVLELRKRYLKNLSPRKTPTFRGKLGDVNGIVYVSPNYVNFTMQNGLTMVVRNVRVPSVPGLYVEVGSHPDYPNELQVLRQDRSIIKSVEGWIENLVSHAWTHTYPAYDAPYIRPEQFTSMLCLPIGNFVIRFIFDGYIGKPDRTYKKVIQQDFDVEYLKPSAGALYALLYIDPDGMLDAIAGDVVETMEALQDTDIPAQPAGCKGLFAVRLTSGQVYLRKDSEVNDFVDLRFASTDFDTSGFALIDHDHTTEDESLVPEAGLDILNDPSAGKLLVWNDVEGKPEWKQNVTYLPDSVTKVAGGTESGDVESLYYVDSDVYSVGEVASTPGFNVEVEFVDVEHFNKIVMRLKYDGSHNVNIDIYNNDITDWDTLLTINAQAHFTPIELSVADDTDYVSGGVVKLRFYHTNLGNPSHVFYADQAVILDEIISGSIPQVPSASSDDPQSIGYSPDSGNNDDYSRADHVHNGYLDGWISDENTWTYSSVDNPTGILTVNADVTNLIQLNDAIKFTNNGNTIYGIVSDDPVYSGGNTTIKFLHEINPGTNAALNLMANSAITNPFYSHQATPFGFPTEEESWSLVTTSTSRDAQASPSATTWYNPGSRSLAIHIGCWDVWKICAAHVLASPVAVTAFSVRTTLSTANNSESDNDFHSVTLVSLPAGTNTQQYASQMKRKRLRLTSKTTYYLNILTGTSGATTLAIAGDVEKTFIKAVYKRTP